MLRRQSTHQKFSVDSKSILNWFNHSDMDSEAYRWYKYLAGDAGKYLLVLYALEENDVSNSFQSNSKLILN